MAETQNKDLDQLLEHLRRTRGFDFGAYKRASLQHRIHKRLQTINVGTYADYVDYLEVHPDEFGQLFNTILINVTDFFRDEEAWNIVARDVIPRIIDSKNPGDPVRVWSAGCASGQEAYTMAMLLCEALGDDQYRERVKIYATDVDEDALNEARLAVYTAAQIKNVPETLRERYFEPINGTGRFVFRKDPRRGVIFGRHDLLQDAPISRVDLLICRNTLMYFNAEAQARILARFDFALNGGGFLFLGKAELLLTRNTAFIPVDVKRRIFAKISKDRGREPLVPADGAGLVTNPNDDEMRLRTLALDLDPVPQIVLDLEGGLVLANLQARHLLGLGENDGGQRLRELPTAYRPVDLRRLAEQTSAERRVITTKDVEWLTSGVEKRYFDIAAVPLPGTDGSLLGIKILFTDITRYHRLQDELQRSHQELETANEELQSSNEELETTNEELQSTVEELETTNEELQSTNEELETMNEELQSTNEEMETANNELQQRSGELHALNAFLEAIMASLRDGVVVLDRDLGVRAWNARSEDLWGLRAHEVRGQNFLNLDIGLPVEQLRSLIRAALAAEDNAPLEPVVLEATNRRGKPVRMRVEATRLAATGPVGQGVILVMHEARPELGP